MSFRRRMSMARTALRASLVLLVVGAVIVAAGCGSGSSEEATGGDGDGTECAPVSEFDAGNFPDQALIDNGYLPFEPGTRLVLQGTADRTGELMPHTVSFTVTDLVKTIDGVDSVVVWDVDENDGEVVESELAFFAQDNDGNVWNTGEYPEEYENGEFTGAPSTWISGQADAVAGVHMSPDPDAQVGGPEYLQGDAPAIEFLDCASVVETGVKNLCVPAGCFDDVVVTHERSPLDPDGGIQVKYHAPGIGIVKVGAIDDPEGETLVLVERVKLDEAAMEEARQQAKQLDERAYENADVYAETEPLS